MILKTRIFLAFIVGLGIVGLALWWVAHQPPASTAVTLNLEGSNRTFIQVTDTNQNGLPDWQEALASGETIDFDEINPNSVYAPETETGKALQTITEKYLENKAAGGDEQSLENMLSEAEQAARLSIQDEQYQEGDLNLSLDISEDALRRYGNGLVEILLDHPLPEGTRNEIDILNDALARDNPEILKELDPIIAAYTGTLAQMLVMPVPENMSIEHLALSNVYRALLEDIKAFRAVFDDAVPSMLRTKRYPMDNIALYTAITNLYEKLDRLGIKWSSEDTASTLIRIE